MIAIRLLSRVEHNINYAPTTVAFESQRNAALSMQEKLSTVVESLTIAAANFVILYPP